MPNRQPCDPNLRPWLMIGLYKAELHRKEPKRPAYCKRPVRRRNLGWYAYPLGPLEWLSFAADGMMPGRAKRLFGRLRRFEQRMLAERAKKAEVGR